MAEQNTGKFPVRSSDFAVGLKPHVYRDGAEQLSDVAHCELIEKLVALEYKKIAKLDELRMSLIHGSLGGLYRRRSEEGAEIMSEEARRIFTLPDIFSPTEIRQITQVWNNTGRHGRTTEFRDKLKADVITDTKLANLKAMGYEFNQSYLAYAVEYVMGAVRS